MDGFVVVDDVSILKSNEFETEKSLQDFLIYNIKDFMLNQFDDIVIETFTEYQFQSQLNLSPRGHRIDLFVKCENFDYLIELKNPTNKSENIYAIGQLLNYSREFDKISDSKKKLVLITTYFDLSTAETIKYFNLPIEYIFFTKNKQLLYKGSVA